MIDLNTLNGLAAADVARLDSIGIKTIESLWQRLDPNTVVQGQELEPPQRTEPPPDLIEQISQLAHVPPNRLTDALVADALPHRWNVFSVVILLGVLSLLALLARTTVLSLRPSALSKAAVITTHDMKPGWVIRSGDLCAARFASTGTCFSASDSMNGLVVNRAVSCGKSMDYDAVLRPQVVATRDIAPGTKILAKDLGTIWTDYEPNAAVDFKQVVNHQVRQGLRKGQVVLVPSL